jgi:ATP-dependent 26S proteasome regulatory subunit
MIFYKNIVLILTSNESKDHIDKMDPAYLRKGRIDETYSMMEQLPINEL